MTNTLAYLKGDLEIFLQRSVTPFYTLQENLHSNENEVKRERERKLSVFLTAMCGKTLHSTNAHLMD